MSEQPAPAAKASSNAFIAIQVLFLAWLVYEAFDSGWGSLSSEVGVVAVLVIWGLVDVILLVIGRVRRRAHG
jgi:hypothetical protein